MVGVRSRGQRRDADDGNAEGAHTNDADWVNAFGTVKRDGPAIVTYLRELFAEANFAQGKRAG